MSDDTRPDWVEEPREFDSEPSEPEAGAHRTSRHAPANRRDDSVERTGASGPPPRQPKTSTRGQTPRRGFRSSKRTTRGGKAWRRTDYFTDLWRKLFEGGKNTAVALATITAAILFAALLIWAAAVGINAMSRWFLMQNAPNIVAARRHEQARDNVLFVAIQNGKAAGYLATRVEAVKRRVYGIAIPDGAFVEVPGQGFEQIGDAYSSGADTAKAAVSNYLSVPFERYVAIPYEAYQNAITKQTMKGVMRTVLASNLSATDLQVLGSTLDAIPTQNVALVPLPVKPIAVGGQRFFQPQREQVASLIKQWWGVDVANSGSRTVLVENGAGKPGIAGTAAEQLISGGFTVVDSKNANAFNYDKTLILLYRGSAADAARVHDLLGVGELRKANGTQGLADIIVVIGKDYQPPAPKTP